MNNDLVFEPAWERTLSDRDRKLIQKLHRTTTLRHDQVSFHNLRAAVNYKGDLLATVLVQNTTGKEVSFPDTKLVYTESGVSVAEWKFSISSLTIPAYSSMPWTFIFPSGSLVHPPEIKNWNVANLQEEDTTQADRT
ncbi:SLAP domain-containing protein [Pseudalkalibacillus caeni]|uniref:SLAP domain-containing protein n=1 Tax=Exobacillus caeni TaxID=2574798 RepID=A0A5R9F4N1_9BACL|nr:SLAP domain-containing protein [Pseudalkalibacillus caeni]TLS36598.1 SLAP domain-containing protein [Pseudalkalibacillus caeni]